MDWAEELSPDGLVQSSGGRGALGAGSPKKRARSMQHSGAKPRGTGACSHQAALGTGEHRACAHGKPSSANAGPRQAVRMAVQAGATTGA